MSKPNGALIAPSPGGALRSLHGAVVLPFFAPAFPPASLSIDAISQGIIAVATVSIAWEFFNPGGIVPGVPTSGTSEAMSFARQPSRIFMPNQYRFSTMRNKFATDPLVEPIVYVDEYLGTNTSSTNPDFVYDFYVSEVTQTAARWSFRTIIQRVQSNQPESSDNTYVCATPDSGFLGSVWPANTYFIYGGWPEAAGYPPRP